MTILLIAEVDAQWYFPFMDMAFAWLIIAWLIVWYLAQLIVVAVGAKICKSDLMITFFFDCAHAK